MKPIVNTKDMSTVILQSSMVAVPKRHSEQSESLNEVKNLSFSHSPLLEGEPAKLDGVVKCDQMEFLRGHLALVSLIHPATLVRTPSNSPLNTGVDRKSKKTLFTEGLLSTSAQLGEVGKFFLLCLSLLLLLSGCAREEATVKYSLKKAPEKSVRPPRLLPKQCWEGKLPSGSFINNTPSFLTIMDLKEELTEPEEILAHLREQQLTAIDNKWGDIPFHFYIDRYGNIFQGRMVESTAPVMEDFIDPEGHIFIMMMNDFKDTPLSKGEKNSLVHLILWLRSKYEIPAEGVDSIKKYDQSLAPGRLLQVYFDQKILLDEEDHK